ncbi:MAG: hypothetical protein WA632_09155 [Gallionella sp.]
MAADQHIAIQATIGGSRHIDMPLASVATVWLWVAPPAKPSCLLSLQGAAALSLPPEPPHPAKNKLKRRVAIPTLE